MNLCHNILSEAFGEVYILDNPLCWLASSAGVKFHFLFIFSLDYYNWWFDSLSSPHIHPHNSEKYLYPLGRKFEF